MSETTKTKRPRRTKAAVEKTVMDAIQSMIEEVGYANVTLTGVAQRAKVEPTVFYRRFENLSELFDKYTHKYDYWLAGLAEVMPSHLNEEESFKWVLSSLIKALYKNKGMQQLLIWELSDDNATTRRTASLRELVNEPLLRLLETKFKNTDIDINAITAIMISGIYYLILHQHRSKFCDIDFSTKQGKVRLENAINQLSNLLFAELNRQNQLLEIKRKLLSEGVSEHIIEKCFAV